MQCIQYNLPIYYLKFWLITSERDLDYSVPLLWKGSLIPWSNIQVMPNVPKYSVCLQRIPANDSDISIHWRTLVRYACNSVTGLLKDIWANCNNWAIQSKFNSAFRDEQVFPGKFYCDGNSVTSPYQSRHCRKNNTICSCMRKTENCIQLST